MANYTVRHGTLGCLHATTMVLRGAQGVTDACARGCSASLGASDAAAARPARTHAAHATRVAFFTYGMRVASGPCFGRRARGFDALERLRDRRAVDPVRHARTHAAHATRVAFFTYGMRVASGLCFWMKSVRHARAFMPPNGDLRRRPPFHAARCRAAFATSEVADNQKHTFPVTIFRVGVKL